VSRFGELVRYYRLRSRDPQPPHKVLTQARLGELLGEALGDGGYTGAAVSEWERSKSHPAHDQRPVLVGLVKVLYACGGLQAPDEADTLLKAGDYRSLNPEEKKRVAPEWNTSAGEAPSPSAGLGQMIWLSALEELAKPGEVLSDLWRASKDHPAGLGGATLDWLGQQTRDLSGGQVLRWLGWLVVWLASWSLTFPMLRWPFSGPEQVRQGAWLYLIGALTLPLGVAVLTRTYADQFWIKQNLDKTRELQVFTHQGAQIGFHLGYMTILLGALIGHYVDQAAFPPWLEGLVALWPVVLSQVAARQVPFNLWRAFRELHFTWADLGPTLAFILIGPFWAWFFLTYHPWLLDPLKGLLLIGGSVAWIAIQSVWQARRRKSRTR
jgi:hypothetical protein